MNSYQQENYNYPPPPSYPPYPPPPPPQDRLQQTQKEIENLNSQVQALNSQMQQITPMIEFVNNLRQKGSTLLNNINTPENIQRGNNFLNKFSTEQQRKNFLSQGLDIGSQLVRNFGNGLFNRRTRGGRKYKLKKGKKTKKTRRARK